MCRTSMSCPPSCIWQGRLGLFLFTWLGLCCASLTRSGNGRCPRCRSWLCNSFMLSALSPFLQCLGQKLQFLHILSSLYLPTSLSLSEYGYSSKHSVHSSCSIYHSKMTSSNASSLYLVFYPYILL